VAEAATIRSMDNPVDGEIHHKNDRFKKFEDLREASITSHSFAIA
jgi:hypothetical protein